MRTARILISFLLSFPFIAFAVESVVVNGLLKNMAIVSIDGERHVLKTDSPSPVDGVRLIRCDSEEAEIEIDGEIQILKLGKHISSNFKKRNRSATHTITPDREGMYRTSGHINGFNVEFLVDTGATLIAMNEKTAKRLGLDYKVSGVIGQTNTASGVAKAWYVLLDRVKVGRLDLENVEAAVIQGSHPTEVLLGNSFLNQIDMNRNGKLMELRIR